MENKKSGIIAAANSAAMMAGVLAKEAGKAAKELVKQPLKPKKDPTRLKADTTCSRPGRGASKADLVELHKEKMRNKRARNAQTAGRYTYSHRDRNGNLAMPYWAFPQPHRIWPDNKTVRPGRMINGK